MTVHIVQTVYGRVLMTDKEIGGFKFTEGTGTYVEHADIVKIVNLLRDRPRGIVVDAGANYGFWSLALAPLAEQVIAIEPQRGIFNMLCGTVALNDLNYLIFPQLIALGERPEVIDMVIPDYDAPGMFGGLSIGREPANPELWMQSLKIVGSEPIQVVRLSDCLNIEKRVSFIKMDIEGSEHGALVGAAPTIERWRPPMFVESVHFKTDTPRLRRQIEEFGYDVFELHRNFLCMPK